MRIQVEPDAMTMPFETPEKMLATWWGSSSLMHIAHHTAAARYARTQRWLGVAVATLGAVVASSVFVAASKGQGQTLLLLTGFLSIGAAVLSAASTSLDAGSKSQRHHAAAVAFQGLRREIEEEMVRLKRAGPKDNYAHLRNRWTAALDNSIPLPPAIHDELKKKTPGEWSPTEIADAAQLPFAADVAPADARTTQLTPDALDGPR
jgi:conflict system pore-forming effector with SLATT domain